MKEKDKIIVFQDKKIRRIWYDEEWFFSVIDVVAVLTSSPTPRQYWGKVKDREFKAVELSPIWVQLKLKAPDGKLRETDCANTKSLFRLIQSIPSKKAEPFKQWLAQVGYDRVQEIQNPELAQTRMKEIYKQKGYSDDWVEKRVRGIIIRDELTEEWKTRGIKNKTDFAILTAEISKATFGFTPSEYKRFKGLKRENLRDHMTDLELIFSMLGERVSTEITKNENAQGYNEVEDAALRGGKVAGRARKDTENEIGKSITSKENFLPENKKIDSK